MTGIDIAIIVIAAASIVWSASRGLVRELFSIIAILAAVVAGWRFGPLAAERLGQWIENPGHADVIAFAGIFAATAIALSIAGYLLSKVVHATPLKWVDMTAGAVFGLIKALIITGVVLLVVVTVWPRSTPTLKKSVLVPMMVRDAIQISGIVDQEFGVDGLEIQARTEKVIHAVTGNAGDFASGIDALERAVRNEPGETGTGLAEPLVMEATPSQARDTTDDATEH